MSIPKYQIFNDLSMEIAKLINNLESELRTKLDSLPKASGGPYAGQTPQSGSAGGKVWPWQKWKGLKGFGKWLWTGQYENTINLINNKSTLKEYVQYEQKIEEICEEIIKENFSFFINEQYDQISDIFNKFKKDFVDILKKYSTRIKQEQEKEDNEQSDIARRAGAPEEASEEDIEDAYAKQQEQQPEENIFDKINKLHPEDLSDLLDYLIEYKKDPSQFEKYRKEKYENEVEELFFKIIDENKMDKVLEKYSKSKPTGAS